MKITNRTNYTQLPEVKELEAILEKEAKRKPVEGKESANYPTFDLVEKWLESINVSTDAFKEKIDWKKTLVELDRLVPQVVEKTLYFKGDTKIFEEIVDYLGEEDVPIKSDLIFVFGSKSLARIEKAIELYKKGFAPKLFISGGHPVYEKSESEAEHFKRYAIENGVPENSILIDPNAITIADNVRGGLNFLDSHKLKYSSIILVTNWFAMRRSWAFMMKYVSLNCRLCRIVSDINPDGDFATDQWYKNENGIRVVFNEFVKMKIGTLLNTC